MEAESIFKLGSEALDKELESKYIRFQKGMPLNIEVIKDADITKRVVEFEDKIVTKYDLNIIANNSNTIWSVSKKVLNTINEHIENTNKFKVILRDTQYEVIPLGLKE